MRSASRYFATVRRAMSMPSAPNMVTIRSSDKTSSCSFPMSSRIRSLTASAECASPPSTAWMDDVKKYFNSNRPRGVAMYLLEVTRESADFRDHVGNIGNLQGAQGRERSKIAFGHQIEARKQQLHRRVQAIALLQLQREAFDEIARQHAGGVEALQDRKSGFAVFARGSETLRQFVEIQAQITRFIDGLDHHFGDEALMGWQRRYAELGFQMAF